MTLTPDSARRSFIRINACKALGPNNIPGHVLRYCAVELTDVFTDIFNILLSQAVVPTCFKATTIIPVPKKPSPSCFNDYRPVALTPILMKCFERHQHHTLPPPLAPSIATQCHRTPPTVKFADDTTVVGLISNRDETNYRSEVSRLAGWCSENNLSLNVEKMKEIVVDFRRVHTQHAPLTINSATVERVSSTKFQGVHITEDLSWTNNTAALAKKAQQCLYFLRKLRRARAPAPILCTFYRGTIESILTSCITVWYAACNASCWKTLQRIMRAAKKIIGVSLPTLQDIYGTRLTCKALCIAGDPTHPSHSFFSLLPSGRRLRSLQARTSRLKDRFIHLAVRKLYSLPDLPHYPLLPQAPLNYAPPRVPHP
uniref:Alkylated DNA repair protein AlkB homologue 8 N-terminal domain-containing protein n=1 Tax=Cyprinus carpio TaxID=7962 RepID=A0A8C1YK04_CYPCA